MIGEGSGSQHQTLGFGQRKDRLDAEIGVEPDRPKEKEINEDVVTGIDLKAGHGEIRSDLGRGLGDRIDGENAATAEIDVVAASRSCGQQNSEMGIECDLGECKVSGHRQNFLNWRTIGVDLEDLAWGRYQVYLGFPCR
jgi:hypothetical protein